MRTDEANATSTLRSADRLLKGGDSLASVAEDFGKAQTPADKVAAVKGRLPDIAKAQRSIELAIPQNQKSMVQSLESTINDLTTLLGSAEAPTDDTVASISRLLSRFRQMSTYTQLTATQMMRQATTTFVQLDSRVVQTNAILEDTRRLQGAVYSLQLVLGEFLANSDKENLGRLRQEIAKLGGDLDTLVQSAKGMAFVDDIGKIVRPAITSMNADSGKLADAISERVVEYAAARQQLDEIWGQLTAFAQTQKQNAGVERDQANSISVLATVLGIILSIAGGIALVLTLQRPIGQITAAMRRIADGRLETAISGEQRNDEIGDIARALGIFKENALSKIRIEERSEEERTAAEHERQRNDAEKRELDRQIEFAVTTLAGGLERLSQGDISFTLETPFIGRLEQLRQDFNNSMVRLQQTISQVRTNVEMIQSNGNQMAASAEDLSKRTEQQAASLEETAAAVDEITVTVRSSAERAKDADAVVREAKRSADASAAVVNNAINAMTRIEEASQPDRADHRRHRRDRLPDQSACSQRGHRGSARRRCRQGLRGRRHGSARTCAAFSRGRARDQGPHQQVDAGGHRRRRVCAGDRHGADQDQRADRRDQPSRRDDRARQPGSGKRAAGGERLGEPDGPDDAEERGDGGRDDGGKPRTGRRNRHLAGAGAAVQDRQRQCNGSPPRGVIKRATAPVSRQPSGSLI